MPAPMFNKPADQRCQHQRHGKGCAIYPSRPFPCRVWSCGWLMNDDTADQRRPDRAHYLIDPSPEFITCEDNVTGERHRIPIVQIWVDPKYPDAHQDPHLRGWIERRGLVALIRYSERTGFTLWPPALTSGTGWRTKHGIFEHQHSVEEIYDVMSVAK
jgi:hypothetical protein